MTNTPVTIFCDFQKTLKVIEHPLLHQKNWFQRDSICKNNKNLKVTSIIFLSNEFLATQVLLVTKKPIKRQKKEQKKEDNGPGGKISLCIFVKI